MVAHMISKKESHAEYRSYKQPDSLAWIPIYGGTCLSCQRFLCSRLYTGCGLLSSERSCVVAALLPSTTSRLPQEPWGDNPYSNVEY